MKRMRAAVGTLVFLAVAPGVVAGVVPWLLTGWSQHDWSLSSHLVGGAIIVGQALLLGQAILLLYAVIFAAAVAAFVHGYEEPTLARRFGEQYEAYRSEVPRWRPRLRPWTPEP